MSKKRPTFIEMRGAETWENAIGFAKQGRPGMLAWMVSDLVPANHRVAVLELISRPPLTPKVPKSRFPPSAVRRLRAHFEQLKQGVGPKRAREKLAAVYGIREGAVTELLKPSRSRSPGNDLAEEWLSLPGNSSLSPSERYLVVEAAHRTYEQHLLHGEQIKKPTQKKRVHHKK